MTCQACNAPGATLRAAYPAHLCDTCAADRAAEDRGIVERRRRIREEKDAEGERIRREILGAWRG